MAQDLTPAQKAARDRARLAERFNAWLDATIPEVRTADGAIRKDKHGLSYLDDERRRALDHYLGGIKLSWHCDEFRRGELTHTGTVRVTLAVERLLEWWDA